MIVSANCRRDSVTMSHSIKSEKLAPILAARHSLRQRRNGEPLSLAAETCLSFSRDEFRQGLYARRMKRLPLFLLAGIAASPMFAADPLYRDRSAPVERRIQDLLGRMTLEE